VQHAVKEICDVSDDEVGVDSLKKQVLSVLSVSQPIIEAALACQSILRSPAHLLHRLLLGYILCLLQTLSLEVNVLVFPLEGLAVDRIDYRAIEDEVRNGRLRHRAAETVGFPYGESERCCWLVTTAGNLV